MPWYYHRGQNLYYSLDLQFAATATTTPISPTISDMKNIAFGEKSPVKTLYKDPRKKGNEKYEKKGTSAKLDGN